MSIFGNMTTEGLEQSEDRLGGFKRFESGAYTGKIKAMYAGKSASGAQNVTVIADFPEGEYRETFYITNSKGENFFLNKDDKTKKVPLPGFTIIDDICLMTTDKPLAQQMTEDKMVNVYDPETKKELPKSVPMLMEPLGKEITFGILKQLEFKQVKDSSGNYVDSDETREINLVDKVFHHPLRLTTAEARAGKQTAEFYGAWVERNKGVTRDKTKGKASNQGGKSGRPGGPPPQANGGAQKSPSLFGNR